MLFTGINSNAEQYYSSGTATASATVAAEISLSTPFVLPLGSVPTAYTSLTLPTPAVSDFINTKRKMARAITTSSSLALNSSVSEYGYVPDFFIGFLAQDPNYVAQFPELANCFPGGPSIDPGFKTSAIVQAPILLTNLVSSTTSTAHPSGCFNPDSPLCLTGPPPPPPSITPLAVNAPPSVPSPPPPPPPGSPLPSSPSPPAPPQSSPAAASPPTPPTYNPNNLSPVQLSGLLSALQGPSSSPAAPPSPASPTYNPNNLSPVQVSNLLSVLQVPSSPSTPPTPPVSAPPQPPATQPPPASTPAPPSSHPSPVTPGSSSPPPPPPIPPGPISSPPAPVIPPGPVSSHPAPVSSPASQVIPGSSPSPPPPPSSPSPVGSPASQVIPGSSLIQSPPPTSLHTSLSPIINAGVSSSESSTTTSEPAPTSSIKHSNGGPGRLGKKPLWSLWSMSFGCFILMIC